MKLQLKGRIVLNPLQRWHLLLAIYLYYCSGWLIDAKKEIYHTLAKRIFEVVVVVPAH